MIISISDRALRPRGTMNELRILTDMLDVGITAQALLCDIELTRGEAKMHEGKN